MIIIDASVAVKWVVAEPGSIEAAALLERGGRLGAPVLWLSEAANALWAKAARGQLSPDEARGQAVDLADAPVASLPLPPLLPTAMRLALDLNDPIYDCFYLAAAVQADTYLVTADRRLIARTTALAPLAHRIRPLIG